MIGMTEPYYRISVAAALERLGSDPRTGLTTAEVARRRAQYGPNAMPEPSRPAPLLRFLNQFQDLLIIVLLIAAGLAFYLKDFHGGSILLAIILINALIGFYQENKAEKILELLKSLIKTNVKVLRDGVRMTVTESNLVPGDIVFLEEGDAVPADLRLLETNNFYTSDFLLTGESLPHARRSDFVIDEKVATARQDNLVFCGTTVARGNALGVVYGTGMNTAIGAIARLSQTIQRDISPLQREINALAWTLTRLAGVVALVLFLLNFLLRADQFESFQVLLNSSFLFAIGVAAACVPQGLPAQISVALSLGVGRLAKKNAVVKRLSAVETLGSTTVICSDKTGTITSSEMTIVRCWAQGRQFEITGAGYNPEGEVRENGRPLPAPALATIKQFFQHGFLASHGRTHPPDAQHRTWYAVGDPTEAAFMPLAVKAGLDPDDLERRFPLIRELPFDSYRKRMTMIREHRGRIIGYMKGSPASVLDCCDRIHQDGAARALRAMDREAIRAAGHEFSARALRVLALAYRDFPGAESAGLPADPEHHFVFAGLVAMLDPPRPGVPEAVQAVQNARVHLIMITGDNPETARAVSQRIGLQAARALTGDDLQRMPDADLQAALREPSLVFSLMSPEDKYRVVKLLKEMGEVVAVTGDGVNDTLSLKQADIGVAMGGLGSDVAREAAEIVLLDDNFSTLVTAIRAGRTIFQNLKNAILSSINSNLGELTVVCVGFAGIAFGLPLPITAVQILAVDLIGEMLPLMALTFDPPERTVMTAPPRKLGEHIVNRRSLPALFFFGFLMGAAAYFSFYMVQRGGGPLGASQAAAYVTIILVQYMNILSRRTARSIFGSYLFSNPRLWGAMTLTFLIVLVLINVPAAGLWFGFEPLPPRDWLWPAAGAVVFLSVYEFKKAIWQGE
jgi:Ca2+-transporting ATPase